MESTTFWRKGQKQAIAQEVGISASNLSNILAGNRGVSPERAIALEQASIKVLGKENMIAREIWVFNTTTKHPAFNNESK